MHVLRNFPLGRTGVLAALALTALAGAACSSAPPSGVADTTTGAKTSTSTSVLTPPIATPTITIHGHTYVVPTEDGTQAIAPSVANGGQIVLTDKGFLPFHLFADLGQTITWTNLSSHPVRLTFLHLPNKSSLIPVGGTFTYSSPTLINFQYVSSSGYHGVVGIGDFP